MTTYFYIENPDGILVLITTDYVMAYHAVATNLGYKINRINCDYFDNAPHLGTDSRIWTWQQKDIK